MGPDWAIYWSLGNFLKPLATINLSKSPTFLGNFCKGVKIIHFSSEITFRQLFQTFVNFFLVTLLTTISGPYYTIGQVTGKIHTTLVAYLIDLCLLAVTKKLTIGGKYHSTTGGQFDQLGFSSSSTNIFSCLVRSNAVKLETRD